ncbi:hypothetical protein F2Q68_00027492 [Brassica cretica]|uniref:Uncharacterized protein n=1 Tax=Brassica cretica TaxID=69181 RepID=A0A8S9IAQ4_BRACR|nr:hypothetical protein F2Q68_00027492 [Brassica cretica]
MTIMAMVEEMTTVVAGTNDSAQLQIWFLRVCQVIRWSDVFIVASLRMSRCTHTGHTCFWNWLYGCNYLDFDLGLIETLTSQFSIRPPHNLSLSPLPSSSVLESHQKKRRLEENSNDQSDSSLESHQSASSLESHQSASSLESHQSASSLESLSLTRRGSCGRSRRSPGSLLGSSTVEFIVYGGILIKMDSNHTAGGITGC